MSINAHKKIAKYKIDRIEITQKSIILRPSNFKRNSQKRHMNKGEISEMSIIKKERT